MQKKIEKISIIVTIPASILGFILFKDQNVFAGIWIGCMIALIGFRMIVRLAKSLNPDQEGAKKQGAAGYVTRYFFYGIMILISAFVGVPILSVLAGIICHKASLFIYTAIEKEDA